MKMRAIVFNKDDTTPHWQATRGPGDTAPVIKIWTEWNQDMGCRVRVCRCWTGAWQQAAGVETTLKGFGGRVLQAVCRGSAVHPPHLLHRRFLMKRRSSW